MDHIKWSSEILRFVKKNFDRHLANKARVYQHNYQIVVKNLLIKFYKIEKKLNFDAELTKNMCQLDS